MHTYKEYGRGIFPLSSKNSTFSAMIKNIKEIKPDVVVVAGTSGLIVAPAIEVKTGIPFCYVRKNGESTHSCALVEGVIPDENDRWLVVDDFLGTGTTVTRIINQVRHGKCLGVYFYIYERLYTPMEIYRNLIPSIADSPEGEKWLTY